MIMVKKSIQLWDHIPTLEELRERADPECDATIEQFSDSANVEIYLRYTGLRLYTNGREFKENEPNIKSEMKYTVTDNMAHYPDYLIPDKERFILI